LIFFYLARAGLHENDRLIEVDDENIERKSSKGKKILNETLERSNFGLIDEA
jgi:hypothetical protein